MLDPLRLRTYFVMLLALAVAVFAPAARGAVPLNSLLILNIILVLTAALAPLPHYPRWLIRGTLGIFILWLIILVLQQIPAEFFERFSAARFIDFSIVEAEGSLRIVIDQAGFFVAFGIVTAGALALWVGLALGTQSDKASLLLRSLVYASALLTFFYLILYRIDPNWFNFGLRETKGPPSFSAGFVNRNNAATWLGTLLILTLGLWFQTYRNRNRGLGTITHSGQPMGHRKLISLSTLTLCLFVFLIGLFLTNSRAGATTSLLSVFLLIGLLFSKSQRTSKALTLVAIAVIAILTFLLFGDDLAARLAFPLDHTGRDDLYLATLRMIGDYPWFGVGLGGYEHAFQVYRPIELDADVRWDRAHNVPLQLMAELGLPFATMIVIGWLAAMIALIRRGYARQRSYILPFVGFAIMIQNSLHNLIDFSIQIPGYLAMLGLVLGLIFAQSYAPSRQKVRGSRRRA